MTKKLRVGIEATLVTARAVDGKRRHELGDFYWATRIVDGNRFGCKSLDDALILRIGKCDAKGPQSLYVDNASIHPEIHKTVDLARFESQQTGDAEEACPRKVREVLLHVLAEKNRLQYWLGHARYFDFGRRPLFLVHRQPWDLSVNDALAIGERVKIGFRFR